MFSVVDTVLVKSLPFPNADRLVTVMETNPSSTAKVEPDRAWAAGGVERREPDV